MQEVCLDDGNLQYAGYKSRWVLPLVKIVNVLHLIDDYDCITSGPSCRCERLDDCNTVKRYLDHDGMFELRIEEELCTECEWIEAAKPNSSYSMHVARARAVD
jgi:hypothetical protein